jgi:hypothetical protein
VRAGPTAWCTESRSVRGRENGGGGAVAPPPAAPTPSTAMRGQPPAGAPNGTHPVSVRLKEACAAENVELRVLDTETLLTRDPPGTVALSPARWSSTRRPTAL